MTILASIVLVVFNEGPVIRTCLDSITSSAEAQGVPLEIIAVNNGSTDTTLLEINSWIREQSDTSLVKRRLLDLPQNLRFSGGLLAGMGVADSDWVMSYSADIFFSAEDVRRFLDVVNQRGEKSPEEIARIGAVVGERPSRPGYTVHVKLFSAVYNGLLRLFFQVPIKDFNWVCLYKKALVEQMKIRSRSVFFHAEILIRLKRAGFDLPTVYAPAFERTHGKPTVSRFTTWCAIIVDLWNFIVTKSDKGSKHEF